MYLTAKEKVSLAIALEIHLQGLLEARREMEEDRATIDNLDDYLDVIGHCSEDIEIVHTIIEKVNHDINRPSGRYRAASTLRALRSYVQRHATRGEATSIGVAKPGDIVGIDRGGRVRRLPDPPSYG